MESNQLDGQTQSQPLSPRKVISCEEAIQDAIRRHGGRRDERSETWPSDQTLVFIEDSDDQDEEPSLPDQIDQELAE